MIQRIKDWLHEQRIYAAYLRAMATGKREHWSRFAELVCRRSHSQVRRMEARKGLV